jgi:hypothetical protein
MPRGRKKRHWLPIVAFLLVATSGIGIGLLIGYALGRLHRGEGPPKPLPVRIEALSNRGDKIKTFRGKVADAFQHQIFDYRYSDVPDGKGRARGHAAMVVKNVVGVGLQSSYRTPDVFRS